MLFNSYIFWLFFAAVLVGYNALAHRGQNRLLLLASYVFYAYWDWRFLSLIWISTAVDYLVAKKIAGTPSAGGKKRWLLVSVSTNLGILGFFKYFGFFAEEFARVMNSVGFQVTGVELEILLPVGISFYTFQTLSYTIDVFRGRIEPTRNLEDFALYVAFFPQLVAGPIERSGHLMPQITRPRKPVDEADVREGVYLILSGLFKKVVIADNMAILVIVVFSTPEGDLSAPLCLVGIYAFAFQIYGDFSGYSDIARGVSRLLGFDLMVNFRRPYLAANITEFWRRWHISLSTWLRDYLYIPLGGNRNGVPKMYRNLMLTMLLGGLWHGASWNFVIWGGLHGIYLVAHKLVMGRRRASGGLVAKTLGTVFTFHLVCLTWIFFRSETLPEAWGFLSAFSIWTFSEVTQFGFAMIVFYVLPLMAYELWEERRGPKVSELTKVVWPARAAVYVYLVTMILFFHAPVRAEFIYFQF